MTMFRRKPKQRAYPYLDGDVVVLGPACFIDLVGEVVSYHGRNYYLREEDTRPGAPVLCRWSAWIVPPGSGECTKASCPCHLEAAEGRTELCGSPCSEAHTYRGRCVMKVTAS